jgi:hypothetical protein
MATPQPYMRLDPTPIGPSALDSFVTPTETAMPFTSGFGSTPEPPVPATPTISASPRATPTKTTILDWIESIFVPNPTEETVTDVSTPEADPNIFWGATLAAVAGATAAYNLAEQRKREKEAASEEERRARRKAQKLKKLEAQWAQEKAWEEARKKEEQKKWQAGTNAYMESKMDRVDTEDEAKWQASQVVIQQREDEKKKKQYTGLESYRDSEWHSEPTVAAASEEKSWWEKGLDWVDSHQTEIALGLGVAVGVGAIILSGGLATPLVAAAWVAGAAAVAAGTVAAGTVALNVHYGREWNENLLKNMAVAGVAAAAVSGAWFIFQTATTGIGAYCAVNQTTCARVEPVLNVIDTGEEVWLSTKLGFQTYTGNTAGALETALEIQSEHLDGGMPGNSIINELSGEALEVVAKYGDEAVKLVQLHGEDAAQIIFSYGDDGIAVLQKYDKEAIRLIKEHGGLAVRVMGAVDLEAAKKLLKTVDNNDLYSAIKQGPDAVKALSAWDADDLVKHGAELAARAKKDAEVLVKAKELAKLAPIDPNKLTPQQEVLIKFIAENSTYYADEGQIVLGKWANFSGGFLEHARKTDSMHYGPHPDMYKMLEGLDNQDKVAWLVNQNVIQKGISSGKPFEFSLNGIPSKDIANEKQAVEALFAKAPDKEIMDILGLKYFPVRMKELRELQQAGYEFAFDELTNSYVFILP